MALKQQATTRAAQTTPHTTAGMNSSLMEIDVFQESLRFYLSLSVVFYFLYLVFNVVKMVGDVLLSVQPLCAMIAHTAVPITTPNTSAAELPPCPVTCATFASWNALLAVSMSL